MVSLETGQASRAPAPAGTGQRNDSRTIGPLPAVLRTTAQSGPPIGSRQTSATHKSCRISCETVPPSKLLSPMRQHPAGTEQSNPFKRPAPGESNPKMRTQMQDRNLCLGSPRQSCSSLTMKFPVTTALSFLPVALANALIVNSELLITIGASYSAELAVGCDPSTV